MPELPAVQANLESQNRSGRDDEGVHESREQAMRLLAPSSPPIEAVQGISESHSMSGRLDDACAALREYQVRRKHIIANEVAITNQITALVARACGYDAQAGEQDREQLFTRAKRIVAGKREPENMPIVLRVSPELVVAEKQLELARARRKEIEHDMESLAKTLPVAPFVESIKGFSFRGLAVIVGEAGDLSRFASVRKLWRYLGYGTARGHDEHAYPTWRKIGGLTKEEWEIAKWNPKRQPQIYGVVTEPLIKHKAHSRYGEVYAQRRAATLETHPEWYLDKNGKPKMDKDGKPTSAHAANDAARIMTKALLADLWRAWRKPRSEP